MTFYDAPFVHNEGRVSANISVATSVNENIYAVIIEVERAGNVYMKRGLPVIALCDYESRENWISQSCVDSLISRDKGNLKIKNRFKLRRSGDRAFITIRWSCGTLGQHSEEGTFFIEPKAHFKILFGCGSTTSSKASTRSSVSFRSNTEPRISTSATRSFRTGIEKKFVLPIKRMPSSFGSEGNQFPSFAELEDELSHIHLSFSSIEDDLSSDNPNESSYNLSSEEPTNTDMNSSSSDSYTASDYSFATVVSTSTTPSLASYVYQGTSQSISRILTQERFPNQQSSGYSPTRWFSQPLQEEPQAWMIPRIVKEQPSHDFHVTQCSPKSSTAQAMLAEARKKAEMEAGQYWIWDTQVGKYKHYDEGCDEPVWYNPPS